MPDIFVGDDERYISLEPCNAELIILLYEGYGAAIPGVQFNRDEVIQLRDHLDAWLRGGSDD